MHKYLKKMYVGLFAAILLMVASALPVGAGGQAQFQVENVDPKLATVAIVTTGGTIAEKVDPKTGGAVPAVSGADLIKAVPGISKVANIGVYQLCNIDSSQMTPEIWAQLSRKVDELLQRREIAGVVVTHGTDTMAEGAWFLDMTLRGDKPVVFTGAMNDASSPFPDGPGNLMNAVVLAASEEARGWGAVVCLNRYVNSARAVRKSQTTNVQTFESGEKGYLGYVTGGRVQRFNEREDRLYLPLADRLPKVVYLTTYAGADGSLVLFAVQSGAKGIVIDGVGAGNVNEATFKAIQYALSNKVPVVISSSVPNGAVEPVYGGQGGGKTLLDNGCILAGDLKGPKARLLLMLGLAHYGNDHAKLAELFAQ
ncbi:asparaginase [Maridesulfovibrio sp. FT414]|uniref:asparaginase n=1 Tax=Maridesulfovibrio sp. FT414 TaxID=2979469 RepID=UPI003D809199